jgi:hypothetical protein
VCGELGLQYHRIDAGNEFGVTKTPEYRVLNPVAHYQTVEPILTGPAAFFTLRSTESLPIRSRNLIAPSRGHPPFNPQREFHLGRCRLNVSSFSGLCGPQKQLDREIPIRSRLPPRLHLSDEARRVL